MLTHYQVPHCCGIYYLPHTTVFLSVALSWLPQISLSTNSKLYGTLSRTILTQTFVNPSKTTAIENAKYNFPLYENCAVVAFRCFVGKRLIKGVVKGKDEAKTEYNEAVTRGETAALLEQHAPDVFRTSLGNIPAGETVKVEIEYIMELKHDAEVDSLRFTIPASIAPRYGDAPSTYSDGQALVKGGVKVSVEITMPSNIRAVQSLSHPISMHLGGHIKNVPDDAFNPKHALVTFSQTSTELGADLVLLVKCADLSSPHALLETHPTIANSKTLMVTLVPKFTLPPGPKPEIVFIVDRSASMTVRMKPLKSALGVFLNSLPVGVKFNICSFGSSHSFLWNRSQPYSADTLEQARQHVQLMDADFGGTEILSPIKSTISNRYQDLPLDIMVLTDGQVWKMEQLFEYIEKETASGDVRLFSLGIGRDVSHALVEGIARVGRGFAQIVSEEKEGMEGKVVRMLRGSLSAHIKDYRLEWVGRPTEGQVQAKTETDALVSPAKGGGDRFAHLFESAVPTLLQTPYNMPPLFPFSRSTVYVMLSGDVAPPSSVWLRGTAPSGDELELEIAVQILPDSGQTIHQLAARKLLQELEEGTSYLHSGKYGAEKNAGTFGDWVEREGMRVGLEYGLASKWTSFVAVQKERKGKEKNIASMEGSGADDDWTEIEFVDKGQYNAGKFGGSSSGSSSAGLFAPGANRDNSSMTPISLFGPSFSPLSSSFSALGGAPVTFGGGNTSGSQPVPSGLGLFGQYSSIPLSQSPLSAPKPVPAASLFGPARQPSLFSGQPGQTTSNTSLFGQAQHSSPLSGKTAPMASLFGQAQQSSPLLGQTTSTSSLFGRPQQSSLLSGQASSASTTSLFGLPHQSSPLGQYTSIFGQPPPQSSSFDQALPPQSSSNEPATGAFGSISGGTAFGVPSPAPSIFGNVDSNPPTFSAFGSVYGKTAFGGPSPSAFGTAASNLPTCDAFGSGAGGTAFGLSSPGRSLFGAASSNQGTFGTVGGIFGSGNGTGGPLAFTGQQRPAQTSDSAPFAPNKSIPSMTIHEQAKTLISLQTFEGSFPLTAAFAMVLGVTLTELESKLMDFMPIVSNGLEKADRDKLWATVLAVSMFEERLTGEKAMWELVVEKAKDWIVGLNIVIADMKRLEVLAREVLGLKD